MSRGRIVLLQLSDIHFRKGSSGGRYDPDADLRNEIERDARDVAGRIGEVNAILVTGDIAFSGQKEEYEQARMWLRQLCSQVGCEEDRVWMTPGNHDIDRSVISESHILKMCRQRIRTCPIESIDGELTGLMNDPIARKALFQPLEKYNQFAAAYGCAISAEQPIWHQDLILNDDSTLRMLGLNSVLFSDQYDNDTSHKLILGTIQALPPNRDGVEYITLCHHPLEWLRDYEAIRRSLRTRVRIQLFGHKHVLDPERIDDTVRVVAGAVHPERQEAGWKPRYNFITVAIREETQQRVLEVLLYPRVWHEREQVFAADYSPNGMDHRVYDLPIRAWQKPTSHPASAQSSVASAGEAATNDAIESAAIDLSNNLNRKSPLMNKARRLVYRYMGLSWHDRMAVAQELGLLLDEDEGVEDAELFRRVIQRAREKNQLGKVWSKVEALYGDGGREVNPFDSLSA